VFTARYERNYLMHSDYSSFFNFLRTVCLGGSEKIVTNFKPNISSVGRFNFTISNDYSTSFNLYTYTHDGFIRFKTTRGD